MGDLKAGASALQWAITAMSDTTDRLPRVGARDRPRAFAVIDEAVWWVTIVDATLVRHHAGAYDATMAGQAPAQRQLVEETLAGLRFVRNQIGGQAGIGEFIEPGEAGPGAGDGCITGWRWKPVPGPGQRVPAAPPQPVSLPKASSSRLPASGGGAVRGSPPAGGAAGRVPAVRPTGSPGAMGSRASAAGAATSRLIWTNVTPPR